MPTEQEISDALKTVKYPGYSRDIISFGLVKEISVNQGAASVTIQLTGGTPEVATQLKADCERTLRSIPGISSVYVQIRHQAAQPSAAQPNKLPGINRI